MLVEFEIILEIYIEIIRYLLQLIILMILNKNEIICNTNYMYKTLIHGIYQSFIKYLSAINILQLLHRLSNRFHILPI